MFEICNAEGKVLYSSKSEKEGRTIESVDLENAVFSARSMRAATFSNCNLAGASFRAATLDDAKFERCNLDGATFKDADMERVVIDYCSLDRTSFENAHLEYARLLLCYSSGGMTFRCARLRGTWIDPMQCIIDAGLTPDGWRMLGIAHPSNAGRPKLIIEAGCRRRTYKGALAHWDENENDHSEKTIKDRFARVKMIAAAARARGWKVS